MANSKDKGSSAEREFVRVLEDKIKEGEFHRVYASGSVGSVLGVPSLMGDINGVVQGFSRPFKIECKAGYSNVKNKAAKSLSIKKEWLDKIIAEASGQNAIPLLVGKFDNVRSGVRYFAVLDIDTFANLINEFTEAMSEMETLYENLDRLYDKDKNDK